MTTTSTYNSAGNLTQVTNSGSAPSVVSNDAQGQTSSMTDGTGTSSFSYDPFGELTSATSGAGKTVSYAYGADGQLTGITYPLPSGATWAPASSVSYSYDHDGRLSTVTDFNGNQIAITDGANGLPATQSLGPSGDTLNYSYDQTGSPSAIALEDSSGTTLQSFAYTDAPDGLILADTDTPLSANSPASYTYDPQGRLASMTPGSGSALSYSFDPSGDLTTLATGAAGQYNSAGELTQSTLSGPGTRSANSPPTPARPPP